jgi:hypothetical protein
MTGSATNARLRNAWALLVGGAMSDVKTEHIAQPIDSGSVSQTYAAGRCVH